MTIRRDIRNQVVYAKKWDTFRGRVWLFRFVPFVDFVVAAGSLATGALHDQSDFDVIVGVRQGRIFTARFCAVILFGALGLRRKKLTHGQTASDKICLSHFVTPNGYCLRGPYNAYWRYLYQRLVPVLGTRESVDLFFKENMWLNPTRAYNVDSYRANIHHLPHHSSLPKRAAEWLFSGKAGDLLERVLKNAQVARIERGISASAGHKPRLVCSDDELEFHPDTRRIEEMINSGLFDTPST